MFAVRASEDRELQKASFAALRGDWVARKLVTALGARAKRDEHIREVLASPASHVEMTLLEAGECLRQFWCQNSVEGAVGQF